MRIMILGAGPGISRSVAHLFGKKGFSVTLVSRNEEKLVEELHKLTLSGISADFITADIANENSLKKLLTHTIEGNHIPEVIVYNAYLPSQKGIMEETWDNIKSQLDVSVGGAFNLIKTMLPVFENLGKGKMFFTGGGFALYPGADRIGVSLGKAALRNLVLATAKKVKEKNIHIATVTVCGVINGDDPKYAADNIAEKYWELFSQQESGFEPEIIY